MTEIIYCPACKNSGRTNRCYVTGYDSKCGHDLGIAYTRFNNGSSIIVCSQCGGKNNKCYITGYDYKCGHDCGWAYVPNQQNATCNSCGKTLNGKWSMEFNSSNNGYFNTTTGRYLGISDGYFLYGGNPDWVYSYCKPCWIKEIEKILPSLGLASGDQQNNLNEYKNKNSELQKIINNKEDEIKQLKKELEEKNNKLKQKENEIIDLQKKFKSENQPNLNSAPINSNSNNFEEIISQCLSDSDVGKIKELLNSSNIEEISGLEKSLTSNIISLSALTDFKSICQTIIKKNIKDILEKLEKNIEEIKISLNNITSIFENVKEKLNNKDIPENISNESTLPLKKFVEEKKKKLEKLEEIKGEIYKIYLKITSEK
jgi:predicted  nucleic acid-binding Zn-ribbon protein